MPTYRNNSFYKFKIQSLNFKASNKVRRESLPFWRWPLDNDTVPLFYIQIWSLQGILLGPLGEKT